MFTTPIIIGGNHHNTLGVIRALGFKGINSLVMLVTDEKKPYVSYSKYITKCVLLSSSKEIVPYLLNYAKDINSKSVIFSCADFVTSELDNAFNILKDFFYLPTAKEQGVCNHYMRKDIIVNLAECIGIRCPKSWIVDKSIDADYSNISVPCIVKPLASILGSKADIKVIRDKDTLYAYLSNNKKRQFIVQEFIDKDFEYQLIGCSLNHGETIIIPGYSKCIRPCPGTNTGFLEYKAFGEFRCELRECKDFIKSVGYQGLFSMEFLRDRHGNDYFMEINMRNDGNGICVTGAGVNLPYVWYQYCTEGDYKTESSNKINDTYVMPEFDDFILVLKGKVSFISWWKDYKSTTTFMEYCKEDPKPYYVRRNQFLKHLLNKLIHW